MGFYPVDPVSGNYQLTTPLFNKISIGLEGGKKIDIVCYRKSSADQYISRVHWNGKLYNKNFLQHALIAKGGKLEIWLGSSPTDWGSAAEAQTK
jgi:putative alpha-1,2-mannosidase